jgi:arylformamidase
MKIIDITQELFSCNVYPGDKPPEYRRTAEIETDGCKLTNISMSVHNGTHIDAPCHFVAGGKSVGELDLCIFYGECTVTEFEGIVQKSDMEKILVGCRERLLFKGSAELSEEAARVLADSRVRLIGTESQSVGSMENPVPVHVILLEKGIIPLEGLNLSHVVSGEYILSAFPLNMHGTEGSPVRAVLIT